jgi:hypothetical protein
LNRDDPALSLKKGTIKEMVDELDSKDIYDAPKFRSLLRIPDIEASVAPIMPVVPTPTPSFSSRSLLAADPLAEAPPTGRPSMVDILAGASKKIPTPTGRPSMVDILAGAPKKKGSPASEPSDRVLRSSEAKPLSLMEEILAKKLKKTTVKSDEEKKAEEEADRRKKESDKLSSTYLSGDLERKLEERRKKLEAVKDDEDDEWDGSGFSGRGLKNHVLPSTVPFGKIALDLNKLFYQNVLSIKRHNGNKIIGHKNKRVSDNFVDIIMKMFENKPITQSDLKNIKDEQMLYDNLIVQSGLHKLKKIPTNIEQTSEQMKNRLGLITGEIEAGNSNKALLTELHELLFKMVRVHLISKNAAAAYYKNIKDQFFTL